MGAMSRKKHTYRFNREALAYHKIDKGLTHKVWTGSAWFMALLLVSVLLNLSFSYVWDLPAERAIRNENEQLMQEYEQLEGKLKKARVVVEDIQQRDMNIYRSLFDADPLYDKSKSLDQIKFHTLRKKTDAENVWETNRAMNELSIRVEEQFSFLDRVQKKAEEQQETWAYIPAIQPVQNPALKRTAAGYGWKIHPVYKIKKFHKGIDFTAPRGTPVMATASGIVQEISDVDRGHGRRIVLAHEWGYTSVYAHLEVIHVKRVQEVERGDVIGEVGSSGMSLAPHLHYEVLKDGRNVNPVNYFFLDLSPEDFKRIVELSSNHGQSFD